MSCLHRFHKELLPKHSVEFLFIGTFNPIWDVKKKGDNPDYFYSRSANQFWCILPHTLDKNCLIDKSKMEKEQFCIDNKIGLTDLIYSINDVNEYDPSNSFLKKGFKDEDFEKKEGDNYTLDITFFTQELKKYIEQNNKTLKAVFLTRKTKTGIPRIWQQWLSIKMHCDKYQITTGELSSPSPRGGGVRDKINQWKITIHRSH